MNGKVTDTLTADFKTVISPASLKSEVGVGEELETVTPLNFLLC